MMFQIFLHHLIRNITCTARRPGPNAIPYSPEMPTPIPLTELWKLFRDFYGLSKGRDIVFFIFSVISDASENPVDDFISYGVQN